MEYNKLKRRNLFLTYTLLYILGISMILAFCIYQGRMPIYHADAFRQHVKAMTYYAKYLRGLLYHLFVEHSFSQQAFSFGLGYGSDILTTLQYYCIGDPLALPVIFLPTGWVAYWFMFLIFLRPYLAGLAFLAFVSYVVRTRKVSANETSMLVGAVVYSFCGQVLYLAMLHPYFSNPLYIFPLMLLGVEIYLQERKAAFYTATVALAAVSNFYYFYMLAVLTALYGIYRVYMISREALGTTVRDGIHGWRTLLVDILRRGIPMVGYAIAGTLTAGAMLIPILVQFQTDPRSETKYAIPLLYDAKYYKQLFKNMISYINHPEYDTEMAFGILGIMCLFMLFSRKGHRHLKRAFAVLFGFLLIPFFGSFMNDLYFVINRWSWGFDLLIAYIIAMLLPEAGTLTRKAKAVVTALTAVYSILLWQFGFFRFPTQSRTYSAWNVRISCVLMWVVVLALWAHEVAAARAAARTAGTSGAAAIGVLTRDVPKRSKNLQTALAWICILSVGVNIYCAYSPLMDDFSREFLEAERADEFEETLYSSEATVVADLAGRSDFYRYTGRDLTWNAAMFDGISSTQFEFSFCNGTITDFFQDIGLVEEQNFAFYGLDDRMIPLMMTGVSYYSIKYDNGFEYQYLPYGYADLGLVEGYHLYRSDLAMPLGYTYDGYITRSAYETLTTNERTEALVYGAVVEDEDAARLSESEITPTLRSVALPYEITETNGVTVEDGRIVADGFNAYMVVTFEGMADCETYLAWDNLSVTGEVSDYPIRYVSMVGDTECVEKEMRYCTAESENYSAWSDFTVNMGYDSRPRTAIRVTFANGTYTFDDLRIVCQPLTEIALDAQERKAEQLVNVDLHKNPISYATDTVTGDITVSDNRILYLNIPYSTGWSATVDGEKAQIIKANDMYMAIDLVPGTHHIELHYRTPGDVAGYAATAAGVLLLIGICVREKRKGRVNG